MSGHQEWLEAPYTDAARREAEFETWCEINDVDPEGPMAWEEFEEFLSEQYEDADLMWEDEDE